MIHHWGILGVLWLSVWFLGINSHAVDLAVYIFRLFHFCGRSGTHLVFSTLAVNIPIGIQFLNGLFICFRKDYSLDWNT